MSGSDLHSHWARLFIASLASAGVRSVVLSPGSRSTPLALAAAREDRLQLHIVIDERAAAFFALGQARMTGRPSLLICTSGSAAGHYLPAIIEATQSHLPLIAVTADRPWDAYDCASAQTIDQIKIFGDNVRHFAELGLPDPQPSALAAVVRIAAQAVANSQGARPGPVHINARFRKPLEPIAVAQRESFCDVVDALLAKGPPRVFVPSASQSPIDEAALLSLAVLCAERPRGLVVCGPAWSGCDAQALREALADLARATGFVIWAEATSGVRFGSLPVVQGAFDAVLRSPALCAALEPQLVIELGGPPVSSTYARFLAQHADCQRVIVAPHGWNDPSGGADLMIWADPATLCQALSRHPLLTVRSHEAAREAYASLLKRVEACAWSIVEDAQRDGGLSEGAVAAALVSALPPGATLMVGNSLAVRDLDLFCPPSEKPLRVLHQRGAAGIDGLIAGAAGARSQSREPLALLLGDLSAQHDLGGLATLQSAAGPLVVVVMNNGGGRIFEQLPIADSPSVSSQFERLFITPQQIDFHAAAQAFCVAHARVLDRAQLVAALDRGLSDSRPLLIECCVPPPDGRSRRAQIWQRLAAERPPDGSESSSIPSRSALRRAMPVAIFLHGFLGSPALWHDVRAQLNRESHAANLPGHGAHLPNTSDDFDTVVAHLARSLPDEGCELVGYSMGARVALALALHAPSRVRALTLIGVDPGFLPEQHEERARRMAWEDDLAALLSTQGIAAFVDRWEQLPVFASQRQLPPAVLAMQRQQRLAHDPRGLAWALRALGTGRMPSLWSRLSALRLPVRLINGSLDEKFVHIGRRLQGCLPSLTHIILPNVGHNVVLESPTHVMHILRTPHGHIEHEASPTLHPRRRSG